MAMDMEKYRELFLQESREHLETMNRLLSAGQAPDTAGIDELFRGAHSIKGMAASMGFSDLAELTHELENRLSAFRTLGRIPAEGLGALHRALDFIEERIEQIASVSPTSPSPCAEASPTLPEAAIPESKQPLQTARLRIELAAHEPAAAARLMLLQRELASVGELLEIKPTLQELAAGEDHRYLEARIRGAKDFQALSLSLEARPEIASVHLRVEQQRRADRVQAQEFARVRTRVLDRLIDLSAEMIALRFRLDDDCCNGRFEELPPELDELGKLLRELHGEILQSRMMPLSQLTGRLPRQIRDLGEKTGKQLRLEIEGDHLMLDRGVLEAMSDPLMHILRNAADHGIEKSGTIELKARRQGDRVILEIRDDGRGMDPETLRQRAVDKGLISPREASRLDDSEALQLICRPGFSTAGSITALSGRGVGMDVVRSALEKFGGELQISSTPGAGSCFSLALPLSAAVVQLLLLRCGALRLALPITRIQAAIKLPTSEVRNQAGRLIIEHRNQLIPLLSLHKILGQSSPQGANTLNLVICSVGGRTAALVIDQFEGIREAFIKPLSYPLNRLAGLSATSILGSGEILFVLDPDELLRAQPPSRGVTT